MKTYLITILLITSICGSVAALDEKWTFFKDVEYCYIQSEPIKTIIPEGKKRGENGLIVYRMIKSPDLIVQITAGFNFKSTNAITVTIDEGEHSFYADSDTAWAKEDKKVIFAMKKGLEFVATGISNKETKVVDVYTLKGFTSAVNRLSNDC